MRTIGLYGKEDNIWYLCKSLAVIKICYIHITGCLGLTCMAGELQPTTAVSKKNHTVTTN